MKKIALLLCVFLLASCLFACGADGDKEKEEGTGTTDADKMTTLEETTAADEPEENSVDFTKVSVGGYVFAYVGEECEGYKRAEGADFYESSKPSVATVDSEGSITPHSPGVTLIGYEKDGEEKAYALCVFSEDGGPDRSAGDPQVVEAGSRATISVVVSVTEYLTSNERIADVTNAPSVRFGEAGYAVVTASNVSRPFFYAYIVYDRTTEK